MDVHEIKAKILEVEMTSRTSEEAERRLMKILPAMLRAYSNTPLEYKKLREYISREFGYNVGDDQR